MYEVQYIAPVDWKRGTAEISFSWKGGELMIFIDHERRAFSFDIAHTIVRFRRWRDPCVRERSGAASRAAETAA